MSSHPRHRRPLPRTLLSGLLLLSTLLGPGLHTHASGSEAFVRLMLQPGEAFSLVGTSTYDADCDAPACPEHRISGDHSHCPVCFLQAASIPAGQDAPHCLPFHDVDRADSPRTIVHGLHLPSPPGRSPPSV